jgi:hypothetical protein
MLCTASFMVFALATQAQDLELEREVEWLGRRPIGEPVDPGEVEVLDEAAQAALPVPAPGSRCAEIDGVIVELDPESYELLQLVRRSAGVAEAPESALEVNADNHEDRDRGNEERGRDDGEDARAQGIPRGHLPPPGSCRVRHPDRPPGQQPPPTSCDVDVPVGAFLVRG